MQLLSSRRSGPLRVREVPRVCWLESFKGGQQRLEDHDYWLRLLAAYSALTGEVKVGSASDVCHDSQGVRDLVHQPFEIKNYGGLVAGCSNVQI